MPDPIMTSFQTFAHYATCKCVPKPVRHSANPPVDQQQLEAGHESVASAGVSSGPRQETPGGQRMRSSLSSEIGRAPTPADREAIKFALAALDTSLETTQGTSSTAGRAALTPETAVAKLNKTLQAAVSDPDRFNAVSHHLLHELMDAPPHVQRQVGQEVLAAFRDKLTPLAATATDAILYAATVHDRYHPKEGLPRQYGWEVSPVKHGLYDVLIASLRSRGTLPHPLYRMPRLDQMATEMARQAHDPDAPTRGFAISRMASFFHQVAFYFDIDRSGEKPALHIMPFDSEKRGKEIGLQLGECLKAKGCKVNIDPINVGTQFSPAGCPMFSPFNKHRKHECRS